MNKNPLLWRSPEERIQAEMASSKSLGDFQQSSSKQLSSSKERISSVDGFVSLLQSFHTGKLERVVYLWDI